MKRLILLLLALGSVGSLFSQEQSVMIKEPAEQCYQDLKQTLVVIRFDDAQMMVTSRPLVTTTSGNVLMFARVFPEKNDTSCKIVVGIESPDRSVSWNAANSSYLWQTAHTLAGKIESTRKAREKAAKKAAKE
jgi:hypothetical protein